MVLLLGALLEQLHFALPISHGGPTGSGEGGGSMLSSDMVWSTRLPSEPEDTS